MPLNLYAVISLFPTMADTQGGTVVTVYGEGFVDLPSLSCDFNGTFVPATLLSSRTVTCVAPAGGDERCEGVPLEVTVFPHEFTQNKVSLRRVSSPVITKAWAVPYATQGVDNAYGPLEGGGVVALVGRNFEE